MLGDMPTARNHHYLPQAYLKGFTRSGGKKSKLQVLDIIRRKAFETIPRNVGGIRDFNRIELEGHDPDAFENALSKFEGEVSQAIATFEEDRVFEGKPRLTILNLVALMAVRSPQFREQVRRFMADISGHIMDLSLATKERWESLQRQMEQDGHPRSEISYEKLKQFHESKQYELSVNREYHIALEISGMNAVLPALLQRSWTVIEATEDSGPFITSDHPVMLVWKNPEQIPRLYRTSPGHAMRDTEVSFPVTRNLCITGEFEGETGHIHATRQLVSLINARTAALAHERLFASKWSFGIVDPDGHYVDGNRFWHAVA